MAEAELARFIDRYTIEYVRTYPHPIERVWRAITEAAEIGAWFFPPAQVEARAGAAYALGGPESGFRGMIQRVEPPRFIRYGGPQAHGSDGYWQFELEVAPSGTRMTFVQHSQPGAWSNPHGWAADPANHPAGDLNPWRPATLSGWHVAFDHLEDLMDAAPFRQVDEAGLQDRYRDLMRANQP